MIQNLPIPLDDELAIGVLGRFARLNAIPSITWATQSIKSAFPSDDNVPALWLVAQACGAHTADFTAKHSMIPVLYPVSPHAGSEREANHRRHLAYIYGLGASAGGRRWCPRCAQIDHGDHGFAYWRRRHQINGIDWCPTHHIPLSILAEESVISEPKRQPALSQLTVSEIDLQNELASSAIHRLQGILLGWLHRPEPVHVRAWSDVVRERCHALDLRIGEVGKRPVTSDLILEHFPQSWLKRHMPEVASKQALTCIRKIDGACIDRHVAYPALACAAILAVLFDSAEEALTTLDLANRRIAAHGNAVDAATQALGAFLAGAGLQQACRTFGAGMEDVESLLRNRCSAAHELRSPDTLTARLAHLHLLDPEADARTYDNVS